MVLKPQSRNTLHWLQTSLLCAMPVLSRPPGDALNFTNSLQPVISFFDRYFCPLTAFLGRTDHPKCQLCSTDAFNIQINECFANPFRDTCIASESPIHPPRGQRPCLFGRSLVIRRRRAAAQNRAIACFRVYCSARGDREYYRFPNGASCASRCTWRFRSRCPIPSIRMRAAAFPVVQREASLGGIRFRCHL